MGLEDLPVSAPSHNPFSNLNLDDMDKYFETMIPTGIQPAEAPMSSQASNAKAARVRHKNYKQIQREAIHELRNRGLTLVDAAKVLGVSRSTLKRRLKEYGIPVWRLGRKNQGEYTVRVQDECGGSKGELSIYGDTRFDTLRYILGLKAGSKELVEYERDNKWFMISDTAGLKLRLDELSQIREEAQRILVLRVSP